MAECVGCGYCCIKTPCDAARRLYPGVKVCPQLEWHENRYMCGLMMIAGPLGDDYRRELFAGSGCCCALNSWRSDVKKREPQLNRTHINPIPEVMQVFLSCLGRQFMSSDIVSLTINHTASILKEKGYADDEIDNIVKGIQHSFSQNRSTFMEGFMG